MPLESDLNDLFWMSTWTESRSLFQWLYWADFLTGLAQVETDFQWEGIPLLAIAASGLKFFLSNSPFPSILFHSSILPPFLVIQHSSGLPSVVSKSIPGTQTNVRIVMWNYFVKWGARDQTLYCLSAFSTLPVLPGITFESLKERRKTWSNND